MLNKKIGSILLICMFLTINPIAASNIEPQNNNNNAILNTTSKNQTYNTNNTKKQVPHHIFKDKSKTYKVIHTILEIIGTIGTIAMVGVIIIGGLRYLGIITGLNTTSKILGWIGTTSILKLIIK